MKLDESHAMNQLVLRYLRDPKRIRRRPEPIISPDMHPDPYMEAGSHPDVVERIWNALGASLPVDCRALVYGAPALVHPRKGFVFALANGTQYAIRVPKESIHAALKAGCKVKQEWTGGRITDIEAELGRGWVFGGWADEEKQWLAKLYGDLGNVT